MIYIYQLQFQKIPILSHNAYYYGALIALYIKHDVWDLGVSTIIFDCCCRTFAICMIFSKNIYQELSLLNT